jgi:16S rRNA (guanine527-N7)-methyltransferase
MTEPESHPESSDPIESASPDAAAAPPDPYPNDTLVAALARHQITVPPEALAPLEQFAQLLWEWNEKLNLTRHTTWDKFVSRDVVDAQRLNDLILPKERVLDVGTGGGVPGVVMAILRPDLEMVVCDPVGKKARAVEDIVERLNLPVQVAALRGEKILVEDRFDVVVVRAVAPLWELLSWFNPVQAGVGRMLVLKGAKWLDERNAARHRGTLKPWELRKAGSFPQPGTELESVVLKLWPKGEAETGPRTGE